MPEQRNKILHILQSCQFSGAENVVCQIILKISINPEIEIVYSSPNGQIGNILKEKKIKFIPMSKLCKSELKRVVSEFKPDIIHAHDRQASLIAAMFIKKIPIIVHMHVNNNKGIFALFKNLIWTIFSYRFCHIFWVSDSSFNGFQFQNLLKRKSSILYNVIDKKSVDQKMEKDLNSYHYDIVYLGRLSYQKNPERLMKILLAVIEKKSDIHIAIIGTGEFEHYVQKLIIENNLQKNIDYLGYIENPLKIVHDSKLLLLVSRFEGTPMVVIESQILGVPVVSTPVDGVKSIVIDGFNGFLSEDDSVLLEKILLLLKDNCLLEEMKSNSRNAIVEFTDIDSYISTILQAYKICRP